MILKNSQKFNLNYSDISLYHVLEELGQEAGFSYKIIDNNILITGTKTQDKNVGQTIQKLTGRVVDSSGDPIIGASVYISGTTIGTITGTNGEFALDVKAGQVIVFSSVGYESVEITYSGQESIEIVLEALEVMLEDVIVVGYGVQKKSVVTGAISLVRTDEIVERPITNPEQALQGKVTGVTITQNTGAPGSPLSVRIRGFGTSGHNEPLYIVDGVQMGGLSSLNPADIQSIEILKDAASGAIYGARAANGVVLVTTKKGQKGKMSVNYNGYYGIQSPWKKLIQPDAYEYMSLFNEAMENDGNNPKFSESMLESNEYNTNWQDELFEERAPITNHHLMLSGGNEYSTFLLSAGYFSQKGIIGGDKAAYDKYSFRINSEHKISKRVKFGENFSYYTSESSGIANQHGIMGILSSALMMEPNLPVHATDPEVVAIYDNYPVSPIRDPQNDLYYSLSQYGRNPLAWLATTFNNGIDNTLSGNFYLEVSDLIDGLVFRSDYGIYRGNGTGRGYTPAAYFHPADRITNTIVSQSSSEAFTWQWENTLSYRRSLGQNNFWFLVGNTLNDAKGRYLNGERANIIPDGWYYAWLNNGAVDASQTSHGGYWENRLVSFFGRLTYNYAEKYLLSATMRTDGSSRFGPENQFGYFPSFSGGWIISKEAFFDNITFINLLKIRGSWGQVGNDAIGDFAYMSSMVKGYSYTLGGGTNMAQSIVPGVASNPGLKWETSEQTNLGIDIEMYDSKLLLTAEYYIKNTKDLLGIEPIPLYVGSSSPISNVGEISNKGFEIAITARSGEGNLHYRSTILTSYNNNTVVKVGNPDGYINGAVIDKQINGQLRMEEGEAFPFFYGYRTDGIFQNQDEIDNSFQPDAKPGDIRFIDVNEDGKIDESDRTNLGPASPYWNVGLSLDLEYRNFDLLLMLQGQAGNKIANVSFVHSQAYSTRSNNVFKRWNEENQTNEFPRVTLNDVNRNFSRLNDMVHIEDGSFLRLKNVQLGYTIPAKVLNRISISHIRLYANIQNLWTLTNYTGFDPEIGTGNTGGFLDFGIDRAAYPQSRTVTIGVNVNF